jgi:hypothetical protein
MGLALRLPHVMPSMDVFFASPRRIYTHYFPSFPLSFDNKVSANDYYQTGYLDPAGEAGKHLGYGGWSRARPNSVTVGNPLTYKADNMANEVAMMEAIGITGLCFDIMGLADAMSLTGLFMTMCKAAQKVDPRFECVPMLDMSTGALGGISTDQAVQLIAGFNKKNADGSYVYPNIGRMSDGRMKVASFNPLNAAPANPLAWWKTVITALDNMDVDIAFLPVLLGSPTNSVLDSISIGTGGWGTATPLVALSPASFMAPVQPQQFRPKSLIYWEASNSQTLRNGFAAAINAKTPGWIQLITWNDFSEGAQIQPCTDWTLNPEVARGFYEAIAYYNTWLATGQQPLIVKDVLYWFHRRMRSTDAHARPSTANPALPWQGNFNVVGTPTEESNIELLAFLTAPGNIMINSATQVAQAGINSMKAPMTPGNPQFKLQRNGSDVYEFRSPVTICGPAGITAGITKGTTDLLYWSGSHSN